MQKKMCMNELFIAEFIALSCNFYTIFKKLSNDIKQIQEATYSWNSLNLYLKSNLKKHYDTTTPVEFIHPSEFWSF